MDAKHLARAGAAVFAGLAFAMALVQLREEPASSSQAASGVHMPADDPLPEQLKACAAMGEAALLAPECRAAWAEKRRRFFGVEYPEAYLGPEDRAQPVAPELVLPSATGEPRQAD